MAKRFTNNIDRAVFAIASLTDRKNLATLKGDRVENPRVCQVMYWLREAADEGSTPAQTLDRALVSYADAPMHGELVKERILQNYSDLVESGCFDESVVDQLRHGKSPYIQKGPFKGEQLWVEHVVPKAVAPELGRNFANLGFSRESENRSKSDKVSATDLKHAERFRAAGLVSLERFSELAKLASSSPSAGFSPNRSRAVSSSGGGGTDPRVLIPKVQMLSDQIEDWERRAGASLDQAEYAQRHTAEQVSRMVPRLSAAHNRLIEDRASVDNLRREVERCKERCADSERRAIAAENEATNAAGVANRALSHWQRELASARRWLSAAIDREAEAERQRDRAASELQSAVYDLRRAEAELESARHRTEFAGNDREGRATYRPIDTTPYREAVQSAAYEVRQREHDLAEAEAELRDAISDRQAAEQRVDACERAVELSEEAVSQSEMALDAAIRARSAAERALEEQKRAATCHESAVEKLAEQDNQFSQAQATFTDAQNDESGAQIAVKHAGDKLADARQRSTRGRSEMEWRLGKLREFDAPMHGF